jgi:ATP-dependent DNA ligase
MMSNSIRLALARKNVVMKVLEYDKLTKKAHENVTFPAFLQKKEDGVYCLCIREQDEPIQFYSRTGNPFYLEGHAYTTLASMVPLHPGVYICELVNPAMSLEVLSGLVNTNRVTPWTDAEAFDMTYAKLIAHDYLWLEEFVLGISKRNYRERWHRTVELYRDAQLDHLLVQSYIANTYEEFIRIADTMILNGGEGAVLKMLHGGWEAGHKGWRQTKRVRGIHADLHCIGVVMGTGKMEGLIAGLKFEWKGKPFTAGLGKGWDLETQEVHTMAYCHDESNVVGQIWHVSALQESSKGVLRLPKVNELRIDKVQQD